MLARVYAALWVVYAVVLLVMFGQYMGGLLARRMAEQSRPVRRPR